MNDDDDDSGLDPDSEDSAEPRYTTCLKTVVFLTN